MKVLTPFSLIISSTPSTGCTLQTFNIEAVAVGQRYYGVVPATVQAECNDSHRSVLEDTQYVQSVGTGCTNLTFTLRSSATISLIEGYDKLYQQFVITTHLKNCPLGFYFDSFS